MPEPGTLCIRECFKTVPIVSEKQKIFKNGANSYANL